jgi:hypothetical protein
MRLKGRIIDKIRQLQGAPEKLARSFALGSFMGVSPLIGMQILISVILSWIFHLHKGAAIAGVINTNWTKGLYLYPLNYKIGAFLLGIKTTINFDSVFSGNLFSTLMQNGPGLFFSLLLGGCITGSILAAFYYFAIRKLLSTQIKTRNNESF